MTSITPSAIAPSKKKISYEAIFWVSLVHLASLAAIPFFSWSALGVCLFLLFTISPLGVTLTYHRLVTHRSFRVPRWFEYTLATVGGLSAQGSPIQWVAGHRKHHQFADEGGDPHSPHDGFFHSHMGHLFFQESKEELLEQQARYAPDLSQQRYYQFLHKYNLLIALAILPILYFIGGWPFVFWGGFVRVTLMLHITWLVNSAAHTWGYRSFSTRDDSRNNWWVALLSTGEGWHNNHHAQPSCAAHGRRWWELDCTYLIIRFLSRVGLATKVVKPAVV
jgi:fatty-acid desaturase